MSMTALLMSWTPRRGPLAAQGAEIDIGLTNQLVPQVPWVEDLMLIKYEVTYMNYEGPIALIEVRVEVITDHHV